MINLKDFDVYATDEGLFIVGNTMMAKVKFCQSCDLFGEESLGQKSYALQTLASGDLR